MTLPIFTAAPPAIIDEGKLGTRVDYANRPTCVACGDDGPVSADGGLCRSCWRSGPWATWWARCGDAGAFAEEPEGDQGEDLNRCGGCGDSCVIWREDRPLYAEDPCAWIREPGIWVFDCKRQDLREPKP